MRTRLERHRKRVYRELRAYRARLVHRHLKRPVRHCAAIGVARPSDEVVVLRRLDRKDEVRAVRHPASVGRDDGAVLRLGGLEPPVRREDVPRKLDAVSHRHRELVRNHGRGKRRAERDDLHAVGFPRLRSGERHLVLVAVLRRLAVHRHVELRALPVGRDLDVADAAERYGFGRPASEHPAVDVARRGERDCVLDCVRRRVRVRRALQTRVRDRVGSHGKVCANRVRSRKRREHIAVCHTNGDAVNQHIGNMVTDIRRDHVFGRIAAVIRRVAHRRNRTMRTSRSRNDRLNRKRHNWRRRLCAKHYRHRAVGTSDDEIFNSIAISIAVAETRTVGKRDSIGEHNHGLSTPSHIFS